MRIFKTILIMKSYLVPRFNDLLVVILSKKLASSIKVAASMKIFLKKAERITKRYIRHSIKLGIHKLKHPSPWKSHRPQNFQMTNRSYKTSSIHWCHLACSQTEKKDLTMMNAIPFLSSRLIRHLCQQGIKRQRKLRSRKKVWRKMGIRCLIKLRTQKLGQRKKYSIW